MKVLCLLFLAMYLAFFALLARGAGESAILRLDPSVDLLVPVDAHLETLLQRDTIFDGPVWVRGKRSGYLLFSDVPGDVIDRWNPDGGVSVYLRNIFTGKDRSEAFRSFGYQQFVMIGSNGITLDRRGRVVYCAYSAGEIVRLEADGSRTVLASRFATWRLNSPNDLVYKSDGSLYFTDSRASSKRSDGVGVPHEGLYVLRAGRVQLLSKDIDHPNGLVFSPDEKYLYVANTRQKNILRFDVQREGLTNASVFIDMNSDRELGAPDGLKIDKRGNIYSTGPGGVWIISPSGRHIGTILTPKQITNLAFGGDDSRTLYMTGTGRLYRITLKIAGQ